MLEVGYKELVLTGINLALYGQDLQGDGSFRSACNGEADARKDGAGFYDLVTRICAIDAGGDFRVRIGSLEPTVIDAQMAVKLAKIKGVCPHFHLSLQSGCGRTLQAMGRPYAPDEFKAIVSGLREIDPLFGITTDVIVGFPGETDADFEESLSFVKSIEFTHVHAFKYSKRPGTRAADMTDQVSEEVKNMRSKLMIEAGKAGAQGFLSKSMEKPHRILILDTNGKTKRTVPLSVTKRTVPLSVANGKTKRTVPLSVNGKTKRTVPLSVPVPGVRGLTDNGIDVWFAADQDEYVQNQFYNISLKREMAFCVE
jgi:threonylcarbamoyladenosine tRNA methylthiotransferase MtaB